MNDIEFDLISANTSYHIGDKPVTRNRLDSIDRNIDALESMYKKYPDYFLIAKIENEIITQFITLKDVRRYIKLNQL